MDDRTLEQLAKKYWTEGRDEGVADAVAKGVLSRPDDRHDVLVLVRAHTVLDALKDGIPPSFEARVTELQIRAQSLRERIKQVDLLGDESIAPRSVFEILGDAAPGTACFR